MVTPGQTSKVLAGSVAPVLPKKIRRKRDPAGTREAILQAARKVLAQGARKA